MWSRHLRVRLGVDWKIVEALGHGQALAALYADLADLDPLRAEALLHAWPEDVAMPSVSLYALERWEAVEEAISRFRDLRIAATREDVFETYVRARVAASGMPREQILDD